MRISDEGLAFIAREEGEVLHVYYDAAHVATIGVGHALRPSESFPNGITHLEAMALLRQDVATAEAGVNSHVKVPLTQGQFDMCVDFAFNCGTGAFASSSILSLINSNQASDAAQITAAFELWSKRKDPKTGQLVVDQGLLGRRRREAARFLEPDETVVVQPAPAPSPRVAASVAVPSHPGEAPGDKIAGLVKFYVGCSLLNRRDELGELVARGVDKPEAVIGISTNCGTTALGILALAGAKHRLLSEPYQSGMAIAWLRQIGLETGALKKYAAGAQLKPGSLLRYNTAGKNDDHVEWVLSAPDASGVADHAGGGRANNAIEEGTGNVLSSLGRPLVEWWDPDMLGIEVVPAPVVVAPPPAPQPGPPSPVPNVSVPQALSAGKAILSFLSWLFKVFFKSR